jgi:hypothetical protein
MTDHPSRVESRGITLTTWLIVGLIAARVAALAYLLLSHQDTVDGGLVGDVHRYVEMSTAKGTPYRDFQVEYPPVTFALIKLLTGENLYRSIAFVAISQFACDLAIAAILRWVWDRKAMIAYLVLGLPLICYPFVYARIDLFAALLAVGGMALVRKNREIEGGGLLAVAVLTKIWPFGLAPVLIVERKVKGLVAFVSAGFALVIAWFAVGGSAGVRQVVSFRDATGWQVESVPGILWHLHDPSRVKFESGAFRTGVMPTWGRPLLTALSLAFVVLAWWIAGRRRARGDGPFVVDALAPLASVLALLLFAPILSPQYVVWMLPFAALVAARGDRLVAGLTLGVTIITTISYRYVLDASEGVLWAIAPVLVRNLLLVALLVVAVQLLAGARVTAPADGDAPADTLADAEARAPRASASA